MKKLIVFFIVFTIVNINLLESQNVINESKTIFVTGSAEILLDPDEVDLQVTLAENATSGLYMNKIKIKFFDVLKKNGIDSSQFYLNNTISSMNWYYYWRKREETFKSISGNLKLDNQTNLLQLLDDLNQSWVSDIRVVKSSNKDIQKYRKDIKIQALKAAKEKAEYLLESIGEKLGEVISIVEEPEYNNYWRNNEYSNVSMGISSQTNNSELQNVAKIKLRCEIKATFKIK